MSDEVAEGRDFTVTLWVMRLIAVLIAGYGAFCFWQADIISYLLLKVEFAFIDYEKNAVLVLFQYMSITGVWVFIAYYAAKGIGKFSAGSGNRKEKKQ